MLGYTARMVAFGLRELAREPAELLDEVRIESRAWPRYCDNNRHINNAQYFVLMDYGRNAWYTRTRLLDVILRERCSFIAAGATIAYRRPVDLMQTFSLATTLEYFDEDWVFHAQTFRLADDSVAARALVRTRIRNSEGTISLPALLARHGRDVQSPPISEEVAAFTTSGRASIGWIKGNDADSGR